jgi:hypothetical protein
MDFSFFNILLNFAIKNLELILIILTAIYVVLIGLTLSDSRKSREMGYIERKEKLTH